MKIVRVCCVCFSLCDCISLSIDVLCSKLYMIFAWHLDTFMLSPARTHTHIYIYIDVYTHTHIEKNIYIERESGRKGHKHTG